MTELVSIVPAIEISTDTIVEIETALPNLQVNTSESITVEVQPDTYVLSSAGMYTGNMTGKIPTWILDAIQEQLTTGDGNISSVLDDIQLLLDGLQVGVNQAISQIENTNTSMSALETSVVSRLNGNEAAILDVYATRVTPTEAQAIAVQAIGSTFNGNVDAYIGNLASVYTNATSAIATDIHTLQVSYNDQTARIDTVEEVSLSKNATIRSSTAPTLITNPLLISGDLWINTTNNVTKSWNGSSWVDITNTNAQQAYTWSATASKLITGPDGSVTGWSFGDGSNTKSNFKIKAENFSISDGVTGYTPFSITGSDIQFNGKVSFSSVTGTPTHTSGLLSARPATAVLGSTYVATNESNKLYTYTATGWKVGGATSNEVVTDINAGNTTTIDGGKITTGSISADRIDTSDLIANNIMSSSAILGNRIEGSLIQGARIEGAIIKASYLDLDGDLEVLTDYHITTAMYASNPSLYTDAVLLSGEYRLATISSISTEVMATTVNITNTTNYSTYSAEMPLLRNKTYSTNIFGYNQGSVGTNRKYRRARPYIAVRSTVLYESALHTWYQNDSGSTTDNSSSGAYHDLYVYFGNVLLLHLYGGSAGTSSGVVNIPAVYANGVEVIPASTWNNNTSVSISSNGFTFTIASSSVTPYYTPVSSLTVTLQATITNMLVPFDVLGPFTVVVGPSTFVNGYTVRTPQIIVNNML